VLERYAAGSMDTPWQLPSSPHDEEHPSALTLTVGATPDCGEPGQRARTIAQVSGLLLLLLWAAVSSPARGAPAVAEETIHISGPLPGLRLGLRHAASGAAETARPVVLILPGAAVPVSANADYPFTTGRSLMTALAENGLDVWALDYYGFGESDRYPEMNEAADKHGALGTAEECADQVDSAVTYLKEHRRAEQVMLIGDSGGSLVAGLFAARRPLLVARLVLFGPVTPFTGGPSSSQRLPAYDLMTPQLLWNLFTSWSDAVGGPAVLDPGSYQAWAEKYLRSDPTSRTRSPPSVKIPNGRQADLAAVASGRFPYDPGAITAPTLVVMGEWDAIATYPGAEWLLHALRQAKTRRLVVLGHGSHTIQFETERNELYRTVADFLGERR
jgi:alpha-beta hydrolase superfamily lysophospholipase